MDLDCHCSVVGDCLAVAEAGLEKDFHWKRLAWFRQQVAMVVAAILVQLEVGAACYPVVAA